MAIKKYVGTDTFDFSNFCQWLGENKSGTFLESATITTPTTNTLEMVLNNTTFTLKTTPSTTTSNVVELTNVYGTLTKSNNYRFMFRGAMICKNGIIFNMSYGSDNTNMYFVVCLSSRKCIKGARKSA